MRDGKKLRMRHQDLSSRWAFSTCSWNWAASLARASSGVQGLAPRGTGGGEKTSSQSEHLKAMGAPATWSVRISVGIWSSLDNGDGTREFPCAIGLSAQNHHALRVNRNRLAPATGSRVVCVAPFEGPVARYGGFLPYPVCSTIACSHDLWKPVLRAALFPRPCAR